METSIVGTPNTIDLDTGTIHIYSLDRAIMNKVWSHLKESVYTNTLKKLTKLIFHSNPEYKDITYEFNVASDIYKISYLHIKEVIIEPGYTAIRNNAFADNKYLESIVIPDTIEDIGDAAFLSCIKLREIHIPPNIKKIGMLAFADTAITEATIYVNNNLWFENANRGKRSKWTVPKTGAQIFYSCNNLMKLTIKFNTAPQETKLTLTDLGIDPTYEHHNGWKLGRASIPQLPITRLAVINADPRFFDFGSAKKLYPNLKLVMNEIEVFKD